MNEDLRSTITDSEGRARLEGLPAGDWVVWAAADGRIAEETDGVTVVAGEETEVAFTLEPGVPFSGRVVDTEGRPGAKAYVEAIAGGSFEGYGEWKDRPPYDRVTTDEDGTFRIRGIPPGAVSTLVISADGFREGRAAVRAQGRDDERPAGEKGPRCAG